MARMRRKSQYPAWVSLLALLVALWGVTSGWLVTISQAMASWLVPYLVRASELTGHLLAGLLLQGL